MKIKPVHVAVGIGALFLLSKNNNKKAKKQEQTLSFPDADYDPEPSVMLAAKQKAKRDALAKKKEDIADELASIAEDEASLTADTEETALDVGKSAYIASLTYAGNPDRDEARAEAFAAFSQVGGRDQAALQDVLNKLEVEMLETAQAVRDRDVNNHAEQR